MTQRRFRRRLAERARARYRRVRVLGGRRAHAANLGDGARAWARQRAAAAVIRGRELAVVVRTPPTAAAAAAERGVRALARVLQAFQRFSARRPHLRTWPFHITVYYRYHDTHIRYNLNQVRMGWTESRNVSVAISHPVRGTVRARLFSRRPGRDVMVLVSSVIYYYDAFLTTDRIVARFLYLQHSKV